MSFSIENSPGSPLQRSSRIGIHSHGVSSRTLQAYNRLSKYRTLKEEITGFYARQSEGIPSIPSYLSNSMYAHLLKEQYNLFQKSHDEVSSKKVNSLDEKLEIPLLERLPHGGKKVPSSKEYMALSELLTHNQFNLSLAMQDLRLPTAWEVRGKDEYIEASGDRLELTYTGDGKDDTDVAPVRANYAIRKQCGIYYFEIKVISKGTDGHIGIGFCRKITTINAFGWEEHSWGYHGESGNIYSGPGTEKTYGPKYGTGDIIGCGIDFRDMSAFYTKNGLYLGTAFKNIKDTEIYPFVGFKTPREKIEANFGSNPFKFDIQQYIAHEKRQMLQTIYKRPAQKNNVDNVVMEYLKHCGYNKSALALEKAIQSDSEQEDSMMIELDLDTVHRQEIRKLIIQGEIDKAIIICNTHYPSVLKDHPEVEFRLGCRKFMEMVKRAQSDPTKSISNHDEYEAQSLQVSKNNNDHTNKRNTTHADLDSSNSKNKKQKLDQTVVTLQDAIKFGNALRTRYGPQLEKDKAMDSELLTAFSTLAYTDLTDKAVAYLYEIPYIETVVSEINSAILESIGKYPNSSIERIYCQVSVAIEELSLGGNAKAALIDPERDCLKDTII